MLRDFAFCSCKDIILVLQKENLKRGYHAILGLLSVKLQNKKMLRTLHLWLQRLCVGTTKRDFEQGISCNTGIDECEIPKKTNVQRLCIW